MPLLMIVKTGKKLGSFLATGGYTFVDDLGYVQAKAVEIGSAELSGYVLVSVSRLLVPEILARNNMQLADSVPMLVNDTVVSNTDLVDYYIAVQPSERHLLQNITELDLKAIWIDQQLFDHGTSTTANTPLWMPQLNVAQDVVASLNIPVQIVTFGASNNTQYISDLPVSINSGIWGQETVVRTQYRSTPMPVLSSTYSVSDAYASDLPVLISVGPYSTDVTLVDDVPVLLPHNELGYTLRWLPPIPVRVWDTEYSNQMYESTATAVVNFVQFFTQDLESSTPKPIPIYKSSYVNTDSRQTAKAAPIRSRVFNNLIKVEVLPNLTGSVTSQAYSMYSMILLPATMSSATLTPQATPNSTLVMDSTFSASTWQMKTSPVSILSFMDVQTLPTPAARSSGYGAPIADGLVAAYDAGYALSYLGSGTVWKDVAGTNNATLTTTTFNSANDGGMVLAGSGYALTADADNLDFTSALTIEAVIKPTALANVTHGMGIVSKGTATDSSSASYELLLSQSGSKNYLLFRIYVAGQLVASPKSIPIELNTISYVSATYDGGTMRVFVNSIEDGTGVAASGNLQTNTGGLCIGSRFFQRGTASTSGFIGTIYSARVYGRALSQVEIATNFNAVRSRYGI